MRKIRGRCPVVRTSLYADDAAIFVTPTKKDVHNLAIILKSFGETAGFTTNFQKSSMAAIRCGQLDLDDILHSIPATLTSFPMKYLGLPLSIWQLKRVDFQHLEDKVATKLPPSQGRNITTVGRSALLKLVLTSHVIYHITPLVIPPSVLQSGNKIERAFLWSDREKTTGAKCKVN